MVLFDNQPGYTVFIFGKKYVGWLNVCSMVIFVNWIYLTVFSLNVLTMFETLLDIST